MASNTPTTTSPGFDLGLIYYPLFRHKWKIIICTVLGLAGAVAFYKLNPPPFQSEAKLFIRFVISEGRSEDPGTKDSVTMSADGRGSTVISSELEIIGSRDLAQIVARNIGPEKILEGISDSKSLVEATTVVYSGMTVDVPRGSSTIKVSFQHKNQELVQPVLREIVSTYLKRHVEIHRAAGMVGEFLAQETDQLRARLTQTEEELRKVNAKAGVVSLEASKQAFSEQMSKIREAIFSAEVELASRTTVYSSMTNQAATDTTNEKQPAPAVVIPTEKIDEFQKLNTQLALLRKKEQELLVYFKESATRVLEVRSQITETENLRQQLLTDFPGLAQVAPVNNATQSGQKDAFDPQAEGAQISALQARIKVLNQQLAQIRTEASNLDQLEISILELRRRKNLEETNYQRYAAGLEQSRIREAMGDGKVSNISIVQSPTPAFRDWTKIEKISAGIGVGGLIFGLAWVALIEFFLDRSVRRPAEVEALMHAPLFISIPRLKLLRGADRKATAALPAPASVAGAGSDASPKQDANQEALTTSQNQLEPFHQTLRDRLISYFESINLRHKPKLIAVTGLGRGSGVTTTASGLARSLSETGEGNVLLVDMTQGQGSAQHFQRGTQIGLDQLLDTRNSAFVRDNLYVVSEHSGGDRLSKGLPQRFNQLVPKLKASDFDYIIFDMPPVNQISITPRLAGFMDMTLLVVESEKTDRHIAERAAELLAQSKTNVGVVLNKNKSYIPAKLQQDREFLMGM
jgi:polysaccharide biosynthesis transport protein